mgnify:CR=1 FL=1
MSAHQFPDIYEEFGIDLSKLGCVMLPTETPDTSFIDESDLYVSPDPAKFWIKGRAGDNAHVTLRYGLLPQVRRKHVDRVLADLTLPSYIQGMRLEKFDSPYPDEPYECIVLRIYPENVMDRSEADLLMLNQNLAYLPNVNTFPGYKAHITLAYVQEGWYADYKAGRGFEYPLEDEWIATKGVLDYGKMQP